MKIRVLDAPPYVVDADVLQRYPQRQTVFQRRDYDADATFYQRSQHPVAVDRAVQRKPGYSRVEAAFASAAWTVANHFHGAYSDQALGSPDAMLSDLGRYDVVDREAMSEQIKAAARSLGAGSVGIAEFDRRWLYASDNGGRNLTIPAEFEWAIVVAIPMDPVAIRASPDMAASAATGVGYSRMAFVTSCLAQFIRKLGYRALPMGNDTALSIPLAIDAGLGELGRHGMLVTPKYGPCVRLCKVVTDLPLVADAPISFGLQDVCRNCRRCADACEVGAISSARTPSYDVACPSNNPGVRRWSVDFDRCYTFWMDNGTSCSTCIAACPLTPSNRATE
jgi:epoxyqueuosine reductase